VAQATPVDGRAVVRADVEVSGVREAVVAVRRTGSERVWSKAVAAAVKNDPAGERSIFKGFNFHLLRHTA
jgi:hypothetical protein